MGEVPLYGCPLISAGSNKIFQQARVPAGEVFLFVYTYIRRESLTRTQLDDPKGGGHQGQCFSSYTKE